MLEFEQQFINGTCKICSKVPSKYGSNYKLEDRKFVTLAGDPKFCICCCCGFKMSTSELIKLKGGTEENGITRQTEQENWNS